MGERSLRAWASAALVGRRNEYANAQEPAPVPLGADWLLGAGPSPTEPYLQTSDFLCDLNSPAIVLTKDPDIINMLVHPEEEGETVWKPAASTLRSK